MHMHLHFMPSCLMICCCNWQDFCLQGVQPDAVVVGKAMGNGFPISGVITTEKLLAAFEDGPLYFNTFAGGNVACATGLAVLQALEQRKLQSNAQKVGGKVAEGLRKLQCDFPEDIGDVRGFGFFQGVEFVLSCSCKSPAPGKAKWIQERMKAGQVRPVKYLQHCWASCASLFAHMTHYLHLQLEQVFVVCSASTCAL